MNYARFLFRFDGRINCAKYWLATLVLICCLIFSLLSLSHLADFFRIAAGPLSVDLFGISASIDLPEHISSARASWFPLAVDIAMTCAFAGIDGFAVLS